MVSQQLREHFTSTGLPLECGCGCERLVSEAQRQVEEYNEVLVTYQWSSSFHTILRSPRYQVIPIYCIVLQQGAWTVRLLSVSWWQCSGKVTASENGDVRRWLKAQDVCKQSQ